MFPPIYYIIYLSIYETSVFILQYTLFKKYILLNIYYDLYDYFLYMFVNRSSPWHLKHASNCDVAFSNAVLI